MDSKTQQLHFVMFPFMAQELSPPPRCIVSDICLPYTIHIANKFNLPRISFAGVNCFCLTCYDALRISNVRENIKDEDEYFVIPGLPDEIEATKAQVLGPAAVDEFWNKFYQEIHVAEAATYGVIMNSFQELEPEYARMYKKLKNDKVWCVGPVSLSNKDHLDKAQRDNKVSTEEWMHQKWLDSQKPKSGLIIRGWAPQLLILSHPSIGGFLTHCGWNSTIEAICAGVPMLTWPLFADQFPNEKLVAKVLKVGVIVGVKSPMLWGKEEEIGVMVKKEDIKIAIEKFMDENNTECEERRERVRKLAEMAKISVEEGGSSHTNLTMFIQDILHKSTEGNI
ncbi:UDP-glycosyltransferase [Stylosanthes scabra]|uniref:UDP-glycosyltransferase n=1 Tax=Stylosanthes scabra TaxID=79078 RepID=A0ABU6TAL2_9FABA|nr:UDP-glycosyltransferase [Stylosanthes scabra]